MKAIGLVFIAGVCAAAAFAQNDDYRLALPDHQGQLKWSAEGFQIVQNSAKPNGQEIGVRGQNPLEPLAFLGFLFLIPDSAPVTSVKCRDEALSQDKKADATLKIAEGAEISREGALPVALAD